MTDEEYHADKLKAYKKVKQMAEQQIQFHSKKLGISDLTNY